MERQVKINIGDWSDDGHGKYETFIINLKGDDVSDEALNKSYQHVKELVGFTPEDIANSYESNDISQSNYDLLVQNGFVPAVDMNGYDYYEIHVIPATGDNNIAFSMVSLIMFFVGRDIPNFSWDYVTSDIPVLMGDYGSIINGKHRASTSVGYGLFFG